MEIMLMGFGETQACRIQQQFSEKMAFYFREGSM